MTREEALAIFEDKDTVIENPNYLFTEIGEAWDMAIEALGEPKHGEWIMHSDKVGLSVECPFCHKEMAGDDLNYCCKCGAKLGGDT